jgi:catechol 2,3-dioxygenase-like lactoylglutathione lyase family enzyme
MSISVSFRYIIEDVPAAVKFYTTHLGFTLKLDAAPAFAAVERDGVVLNLSGDGSSGKRQLPDGRAQLPGGWNRIQVHVADIASEVARLRTAGVTFLTPEVVAGPGGLQAVIEDPSGNRVELFQPKQ